MRNNHQTNFFVLSFVLLILEVMMSGLLRLRSATENCHADWIWEQADLRKANDFPQLLLCQLFVHLKQFCDDFTFGYVKLTVTEFVEVVGFHNCTVIGLNR